MNQKKVVAAAVLGAAICATGSFAHANAKNVILMISDGASFGAWDAARVYQQQTGDTPAAYYGNDFKKHLMTTYPLTTSSTPTGATTSSITYNPNNAWSLASYASGGYLHQNYTDSAAAGTALSTGVKTYNASINWSNQNAPLTSIYEIAKDHGKAVGTISSVQWSHATPAAFGAHNTNRNNYSAIANDMLTNGKLDLIMGAGHPLYNNNGGAAGANYTYVGGSTTWNQLTAGTHAGGWSLIDSKAQFEGLAAGALPAVNANTRIVGTAQVATTLQQGRSGYSHTDVPFGDPMNSNVPTLSNMSLGALNFLNAKSAATNNNGFFVQIEGGAIDWAAHSSQTARIVEEQIDFNRAVNSVVDWINTNSSFSETLLIVTTDHGNSMPMGPNSNTTAFQRITYNNIMNGTNSTTGVRWWSTNHTNELVPLFAMGPGAETFETLDSMKFDPFFATYFSDWGAWATASGTGYVDNTDVFRVMNAAVVPEPATLGVLALGGFLLVRRNRRAA